jgi:hypothetical protein
MKPQTILAVFVSLMLGITGLLFVGYSGDNAIPRVVDPRTPYTASPDPPEPTVSGPTTTKLDRACRLTARAARQTGPWEAQEALSQALRAAQQAYVLSGTGERLVRVLERAYEPGKDPRVVASSGLGVCD